MDKKESEETIKLIVWLLAFLNDYSFITISDAKNAIAATEWLEKIQVSLANVKEN